MKGLIPIRPSREVITFSPPLAVHPRVAMDRVQNAFRRRGMHVRRVAPDRLEFGCVAGMLVSPDPSVRTAAIVSGGTIVLDAADPQRHMHLELRYRTLLPLLMVAVACFIVVRWEEPVERVFGLLGLISIGLMAWWAARDTVEGWIFEAAEGAGRT